MGSIGRRRLHSSYVVDVTGEPDQGRIRLTDSARGVWFVDEADADACSGFKAWLGSVFLKGQSGALTVFEYEDRGGDGEVQYYVKKFVGFGPRRLDEGRLEEPSLRD